MAEPGPRISAIEIVVPGEPVAVDSLPLDDDIVGRLPRLEQRYVFRGGHSTDMMTDAAAAAISAAHAKPDDIALVITAPSLITSQVLEIPAVAVKAKLDLPRAQTLNIQQGCNGVLKALVTATDFLRLRPNAGDVLVVAGCKASSLMHNSTHGAFFWSDGAGAAILTTKEVAGFQLAAYQEDSAAADWGAMQIPFGDESAPKSLDDLQIHVNFKSRRDQANYIARDAKLFSNVLDGLLAEGKIGEGDLSGLLIPSTGKNRIPILLERRPNLEQLLRTDFRMGHMGGVDLLIGLRDILRSDPRSGEKFAALTASYTAQWGGVLLEYVLGKS